MVISFLKAMLSPKMSVLRRTWQQRGDGPGKVTFDLVDGDQQCYPQLLVPTRDTPITMPQPGKNFKRGPGEMWLAFWIKMHKIAGFYDNLALPAGKRRYEPDLAYIDEQHGIFIDIEIDEPYTMERHIPTHVIGKDDHRNSLVTSAGWIVLRFSELQCIATPAAVTRAVMDVVRSIAPDVKMPQALKGAKPITTDPRWDYETARRYVRKNYRYIYLEKRFPLYSLSNILFKRKR